MTVPTAERDLLKRVSDELGRRRFDDPVTRTNVGERLVAVELGGPEPAMGVAHCPDGGVESPIPATAGELSEWAYSPPDDNPVAAALGVATLNARSVGAIPWIAGDPMAALDASVDRVATVGLFRAAFRKFDDADVRIIEREPVGAIDPPAGVSVRLYRPEQAASALAEVDVLFITGSSLLYGGTMQYLREADAVPTVVLIGATASFLPGPAVASGVTVAAGARVTDPDRVRAGIQSGLCGTDLHDVGLEKVYVTDGTSPDGLDLNVQTGVEP